MACDVLDTSAIYTILVHMILIQSDGQKIGSTNGYVFMTFKNQFLTNRTRNQVEKLLCVYFLIPFLLIPFITDLSP